ncbi:hypothetical protein IE53DRAFT_74365 [Violaceomyces palustris]|uniref:Uncharacterized protein n=1 Tax=Violaceomyces palustris TaxID=1673888 RepID=A0ACD0NYQ2_9BASI|nr:hypothetical protein IE53DRAFT_74365 [Violaceomyces palustris]
MTLGQGSHSQVGEPSASSDNLDERQQQLERQGSRRNAIAKLKRAASQREMKSKPATPQNETQVSSQALAQPIPSPIPTGLEGLSYEDGNVSEPSRASPGNMHRQLPFDPSYGIDGLAQQQLQLQIQQQQLLQMFMPFFDQYSHQLQQEQGQIDLEPQAELPQQKLAALLEQQQVHPFSVPPSAQPSPSAEVLAQEVGNSDVVTNGQLTPFYQPQSQQDDSTTGHSSTSRSQSPMTRSRERGAAKSPLPSLDQLRTRILLEREAAGLSRSASTSAASQAARAYAMDKLLGHSGSAERFFEKSREEVLHARGTDTPSSQPASGGLSDDDDRIEGAGSDATTKRPRRKDQAHLRRSRTIGGLSAMAEAQRKAAFVEGTYLSVPGSRSRTSRLLRSRQALKVFASADRPSSEADADEDDPEGQPPSNSNSWHTGSEDDVVLVSGAASDLNRGLSQRQIARTEMIRKLSGRGRGPATTRAPEADPKATNPQASAPEVGRQDDASPSSATQMLKIAVDDSALSSPIDEALSPIGVIVRPPSSPVPPRLPPDSPEGPRLPPAVESEGEDSASISPSVSQRGQSIYYQASLGTSLAPLGRRRSSSSASASPSLPFSSSAVSLSSYYANSVGTSATGTTARHLRDRDRDSAMARLTGEDSFAYEAMLANPGAASSLTPGLGPGSATFLGLAPSPGFSHMSRLMTEDEEGDGEGKANDEANEVPRGRGKDLLDWHRGGTSTSTGEDPAHIATARDLTPEARDRLPESRHHQLASKLAPSPQMASTGTSGSDIDNEKDTSDQGDDDYDDDDGDQDGLLGMYATDSEDHEEDVEDGIREMDATTSPEHVTAPTTPLFPTTPALNTFTPYQEREEGSMMSPHGGVNIPLRLPRNSTMSDNFGSPNSIIGPPRASRVAGLGFGKIHGDWPESVGSSTSILIGKDSLDGLDLSPGGQVRHSSEGQSSRHEDMTSPEIVKSGNVSPAPEISAAVAVESGLPSESCHESETEIDHSRTLLRSPQDSLLRPEDGSRKPTERLNALLGSSFVREYGQELNPDQDARSSISLDELNPDGHIRSASRQYIMRVSKDSASDGRLSAREPSPTPSSKGPSSRPLRNSADLSDFESDSDSDFDGMDQSLGVSGEESGDVDERYLRKVDRMAERLGRLAKLTRSKRLQAAAEREKLQANQGVPLARSTSTSIHRPDIKSITPPQRITSLSKSLSNTVRDPPHLANSRPSTGKGSEAERDRDPQIPSNALQAAGFATNVKLFPATSDPRPLHQASSSPVSMRPEMHVRSGSGNLLSRAAVQGRLAGLGPGAMADPSHHGLHLPGLHASAKDGSTIYRFPPPSPQAVRGDIAHFMANDKLTPFPGLLKGDVAASPSLTPRPSFLTHSRNGSRGASVDSATAVVPGSVGLGFGGQKSVDSAVPQHLQQAQPAVIASPSPTPESIRPVSRAEVKSPTFLSTLRRKASGALTPSGSPSLRLASGHGRTSSREGGGFWSRRLGGLSTAASPPKSAPASTSAASQPQTMDMHQADRRDQVHVMKGQSPVLAQGSQSHDSTDSPHLVHHGHGRNLSTSSVAMSHTVVSTGQDMSFENGADASQDKVSLAPATAAMIRRYSHLLTTGEGSVPGVSRATAEDPPRRLLLCAPVFQVIDSNTIKDRYLLLFSDLLVVAKAISPPADETSDSSAQRSVTKLPHLGWTFSVKSIHELHRLRVERDLDQRSASAKERSKNPFLATFVEHFGRDPQAAIDSLRAKSKLPNRPSTIAQLLFQTPELSRARLTEFLCSPSNREVLKEYVAQHRFAGVSIESALRMLLLELRFPAKVDAFESLLLVFADRWTESNASLIKSTFTRELAADLVFAIMALNDALHTPSDPDLAPRTPGMFSAPCPELGKEDFLRVFRQHDRDAVLSDRTLGRIYISVRAEPLAQALADEEPRLTVRVKGGSLPSKLTYGQPSETITLVIPAPDPDLAIRLYAQDSVFEPPILTFGRSKEASFTISSKSLGPKHLVFVRAGKNARYYSGTGLEDHPTNRGFENSDDLPLPRSASFTVERAFVKHSFSLASYEGSKGKKKLVFSIEDDVKKDEWVKSLTSQIDLCSTARKKWAALPSDTPTGVHSSPQARRAAESVALQILKDALIGPDEDRGGPSHSGSSSGPSGTIAHTGLIRSATIAGSSNVVGGKDVRGAINGQSNHIYGSSNLDRQQSTSRHYYAASGAGRMERELLLPRIGDGGAGGVGGLDSVSENEPAAASLLSLRPRYAFGSGSVTEGLHKGHVKGASSLSLTVGVGGGGGGEAHGRVNGSGAREHGRNTSQGGELQKEEDAASKHVSGQQAVTICQQNSLLPLVLGHLRMQADGSTRI